MLKTLRHQIRGAIFGYLLGIATVGVLIWLHTTFTVSASNLPPQDQIAQATAVSLANLMPLEKPVIAKKVK